MANPIGMETARNVGSRVLRVVRKPIQQIEQTLPMRMAHARMLQPVLFSHPLGPSADGLGWGQKPWQRRLGIVLGRTLTGDYRVRLRALDVQPNLLLYSSWNTLRVTGPAGEEVNGSAAADVGATLGYSRTGSAWVMADDGIIYEIAANIPKLSKNGIWIEPSRTQRCPRSSFKSGTAGWTLEGTGVGGSAIAADTTKLLFKSTVSGNSMKFTAGNPHTTQLRALIASDTNFGANTNAVIWAQYENGPGSFFNWQAKRSVDNNWWNDSTGAWGASEVFNTLPFSSTLTRFVSKVIPVGGSATAITFHISFPNTGISAGANSWVYHVQTEGDSVFPTSWILTDGASVTQGADGLSWLTNSRPHMFPTTNGTILMKIIPQWVAADLGSVTPFAWICRQDPGLNTEQDFTRFTSSQVVYQRRVGNTNYEATKSIADWTTRAQARVIAARWCSEQGELGLSPYSVSVFVDGVKGSDSVPTRTPHPAAQSKFWLGSGDTAAVTPAGGQISDCLITPMVLPDALIADLSAEMLAA